MLKPSIQLQTFVERKVEKLLEYAHENQFKILTAQKNKRYLINLAFILAGILSMMSYYCLTLIHETN